MSDPHDTDSRIVNQTRVFFHNLIISIYSIPAYGYKTFKFHSRIALFGFFQVPDCERMMETLIPGFESRQLISKIEVYLDVLYSRKHAIEVSALIHPRDIERLVWQTEMGSRHSGRHAWSFCSEVLSKNQGNRNSG